MGEFIDLMNFEFDLPVENKLKVKIDEIGDVKVSSENLEAMSVLIDFE